MWKKKNRQTDKRQTLPQTQRHIQTCEQEMIFTQMRQNGDRMKQKERMLTCSGLRPGGTQAYSSRGQPLSSSEVELRCASCIRRCSARSVSDTPVISCTSGAHLQCRHTFLQQKDSIYRQYCADEGGHVCPASCVS